MTPTRRRRPAAPLSSPLRLGRQPLLPHLISTAARETESGTTVEASAICAAVCLAQTNEGDGGDVDSPSLLRRQGARRFSRVVSVVPPVGAFAVRVVFAVVVAVATIVVGAAVLVVALPAVRVAARLFAPFAVEPTPLVDLDVAAAATDG